MSTVPTIQVSDDLHVEASSEPVQTGSSSPGLEPSQGPPGKSIRAVSIQTIAAMKAHAKKLYNKVEAELKHIEAIKPRPKHPHLDKIRKFVTSFGSRMQKNKGKGRQNEEDQEAELKVLIEVLEVQLRKLEGLQDMKGENLRRWEAVKKEIMWVEKKMANMVFGQW